MRPVACVVLGMVSAAVPVWAQDVSQQRAWCVNKDNAFTADQSIGGCTALIQAGRDLADPGDRVQQSRERPRHQGRVRPPSMTTARPST